MEVYKTTDIVLAATLKVLGHNLVDIELQGSKGIFVFKNINSDVLTQFDLGNQLVEPVAFNNAIKQLTTSVRRMIR